MYEMQIDLNGQALAHQLMLGALLAHSGINLEALHAEITGKLQASVQTGASLEEQSAGRCIAAACTEIDAIFSNAVLRRQRLAGG